MCDKNRMMTPMRLNTNWIVGSIYSLVFYLYILFFTCAILCSQWQNWTYHFWWMIYTFHSCSREFADHEWAKDFFSIFRYYICERCYDVLKYWWLSRVLLMITELHPQAKDLKIKMLLNPYIDLRLSFGANLPGIFMNFIMFK